MKKFYILFFLFSSFFFLLVHSAQAVCPVCTFAVGAGVGMARYLGVEDTISGVWIGGLIASMSLWTIDWLERKKINFKFRKISVLAVFYLLTLIPLYHSGIIGHPLNELCGVDKIILGVVSGSIGLILGYWFHLKLKAKNGNKVYFPMQKVVFSVLSLAILSGVYYIISKC